MSQACSAALSLLVAVALFCPHLRAQETASVKPAEGQVPRDSFHLYYRVWGMGKAVVILGGGPGIDCSYMNAVAEKLGKSYRAILVEQRGTGRSVLKTYNTQTLNVHRYLEDLEALRLHLKLDRWTLLGHSAGGAIAMYYAGAHPERVESLVLVGSVPIATEFMDAFVDNIHMRLSPYEHQLVEYWQSKAVQEKDPERADYEAQVAVTAGYFFDRKYVPGAVAWARPGMFNFKVFQVMAEQMYVKGFDLRPQLKNFGRPVLVINGRQDPIDARMAYETHLALKNSTLKFINRCGHFPWIEQPKVFYKIVSDFVSAVGP